MKYRITLTLEVNADELPSNAEAYEVVAGFVDENEGCCMEDSEEIRIEQVSY